MFKKQTNTLFNITMFVVLLFIFFKVLISGASLIKPFIIAVLFSFAIIGLSNFFKRFKIPAFISFLMSISTYMFIFWGIGKMIGTSVDDLKQNMKLYQDRVVEIVKQIFEYLELEVPTKLSDILENLDLQDIVTTVFSGFTSIFSSAGIILIYVLFILMEYRFFRLKLNLMIPEGIYKKQIFDTIEKIKRDIKAYFLIKTIVSLITGILSLIIMKSQGVAFEYLWFMVIFLLNFIPSVGSIIAVLIVSLFTLVQPELTYYNFVLVTSGLIAVQILMGNIIEPKFMGNKLNLSPLVILLALGFWGAVWGIVGMILSVPIMVIINIILAEIPATRSFAILLSEKGELQIDGGVETIKKRKMLFGKVRDKILKKNSKK